MNDQQLAAFVPDLVRFEGATKFLYRDNLGYATVGIGNLVHDAGEAARLPFQVDGARPATAKEIGDEFLRVIGMNRGMVASAYRAIAPPRVELTDDGVHGLVVSRLRDEFVPGLSRMFIAFDSFPAPAQSATLDWVFNCGLGAMRATVHLRPAIASQDWAAAAAACHRSTCRDDRNSWCRDQFLAAARVPPG
jgi:GH24 family phage-related lysozyme (muramidase)